MRVSDAIALGRVTINKFKMGSLTGCVLGMAANASGIPIDFNTYFNLTQKWPWLDAHNLGHCPDCWSYLSINLSAIYKYFDYHVVYKKDKTLDELIDYVRSIEPEEKEEIVVDKILEEEYASIL